MKEAFAVAGILAFAAAWAGPRVDVITAAMQGTQESSVPTFNADVAPILNQHCVGCHRPNGSAPMPLVSFAVARAYAAAIRDRTAAATMPPWYADPRFGVFKNARGLNNAERDVLARWAAGGAPEGDGSPPPPAAAATQDSWESGMPTPPDLVLELPFGEFELPATGEVPSFSVWMQLPLRTDRFIEAVEIRPSIRGAVHHSSLALAALPQGTRIGRASAYPGGPVLDGIPVYSDGRAFRATAGDEFGRPIFFYVPGNAFLKVPPGFGKRVRPRDYLVWGLHLVSPGQAAGLRAQIGIWYTRRDPHHELHTWTVNQRVWVDGRDVDATGRRAMPDIPPGVARLPVTGTLRVDQDITIHALWPHMHYRGKDMRFTLRTPDGRESTLLSVPVYNPHWQLLYELARPIRVRRGSVLTAEAHYDNSAMNHHNPDPQATVKFGAQSTEEMFVPFIEVSVDADDLRFERLQP